MFGRFGRIIYTDERGFRHMKTSNAWLATMLIVALLIGGCTTYLFFPREVINEVVKEVEVEVPVNVTVEVPVEVQAPSMLDLAVATFMEAVDEEEDEAGNEIDLQEGYDFADISVNKISKDYVVSYSKDKVEVEFEIRLKYDEKGDSDRSERETYEVLVTYEDDEDTIVEIL